MVCSCLPLLSLRNGKNHSREINDIKSSFCLTRTLNCSSVIYQNERYDDWLPRLSKIKEYFVNYKEELIDYHKKYLPEIEANQTPNGTISYASEGNLLETLNLSSSGWYINSVVI